MTIINMMPLNTNNSQEKYVRAEKGPAKGNFGDLLTQKSDHGVSASEFRRQLPFFGNANWRFEERAPNWYGQFGAMTRFVPDQYKDPNFSLPDLPSEPEKFRVRRPDYVSENKELTGRDLVRAWIGEKKAAKQARQTYEAQLNTIKASLDANFLTLPPDIQEKANAARDAWLAKRSL